MVLKKKIKLLYAAEFLKSGCYKNDARTGIYTVVSNVLKKLYDSNVFDITLYCPYSDTQIIKNVIDMEIPNNDLKFLHPDSKLIWLYEKYLAKKEKAKKQKKPFKKVFYKIIASFFKILKKIFDKDNNKNKYAGFECYFSPMFKVPDEIKALKSIKNFIIVYDLMPELFPQYYPPGDNWFWQLIRQLNSDDYYFAISENTKNDFLKRHPIINENKIIVSPLACSERFKPANNDAITMTKQKYNIPKDNRYIFSLCTLEPRKNLIRSIKTFIEFIKRNNIEDMVYVLGGSSWESFINKLEQEIEDLGKYKDKIIRAGYVDDEDLAPLYSGAEWFVYTSEYEGFGLPPLEAMACGTPVITSNNSSIPEVVGDAGIMIDFDNDEQHIEAYENYYYNKELRQEESIKGLKRAEMFSWDKCVNIMIDTINKVCN